MRKAKQYVSGLFGSPKKGGRKKSSTMSLFGGGKKMKKSKAMGNQSLKNLTTKTLKASPIFSFGKGKGKSPFK